MEVLIRPTAEEVSLLGARILARSIQAKPNSVLGLATGRTPLRLYEELIRMHREEGLDFARVTTFNLDEYVGLAPDHAQSYHRYMWENLFRHVNIAPAAAHVPNGSAADLRAHCLEYEEAIRAAGGIDVQLLGLGSNGHIGFNEPTGSLNAPTWIKILSEKTLQDNAPLFATPEEQPRHVVTMGIGTILRSGHCVVLACGAKKSHAVKGLIEGPVTAMCPASALQLHPRVTVIVDEAAAARLDNREHYLWVEKHKLDWQQVSGGAPRG